MRSTPRPHMVGSSPHCLIWAVVMGIACLTIPVRGFAAFGVTPSGSNLSVDTGAGLVFQVSTNSGDVNSIVFNGTQYQASDKNSQLGSGLGTATVTYTNYNNRYIKITCVTVGTSYVPSPLTQYLIVTNGCNSIFMATYVTAEPSVGELRWITRLKSNLLTNGPAPSDTRGNSACLENCGGGGDVFEMADGTTRSKYYGDSSTHGKDRAMELTYCGATGTTAGAWMVFDNPRESDSGGPFFRDIENQCGTDQEVYNYMNSGHNQTDIFRTNVLYGPYALVFTTGGLPTSVTSVPIDYSWIETADLNLTGYVPRASRGAVTGTVLGIATNLQMVVAFTNAAAQYWALAAPNGSYTTPLMKAGTYNAILYQGELAVATSSVTVSAGQTNMLNMVSALSHPSYVFKIGEWDGTPNGFLNATNIVALCEPNFITMHPQDVRMSPWVPTTFTVGSDPTSKFPSIQMRGTNSPTVIQFNLTAAQITNMTLRIGITCAYNNGRPQVSIQGYTSGPTYSTQPNSRSFTIGTYRGNNAMFTYNIPSNNFVVGQNTITIAPISGSSDLSPWLSAGWVYDAIELDGPSVSSPPAAPTDLVAAPSGSVVVLNWTGSAGATGYNVKRSFISGGSYSLIASNWSATAYTDASVVYDTNYYYVVSALGAGGESTNSAEADAYLLSPFEQWQTNYFGCTACPQAAPDADPYGKGISNTNQFLLGLNPTNPASVFRILNVASLSNDVVITWATGAGPTNVVQATGGDGTGGYWTNFTNISGPLSIAGSGDATNTYRDVGGATNGASRYYRVRLGP
ncbi:MAG TPA: rhamnogalacturonan lyase B N-terminal domain-containing protein [Verrucomicrobiae bacterium]|nr:rhamnogalacturonan lyase B N-terminal domain-containing protein [Verrucomicrobiae bacterium]